MSKKNQYDVLPAIENKGLVYRAKISDGCTADALKQHLVEVERVTKKHLEQMANYEERDLLANTANGLTVVGPSSGEFNSIVTKAHNAAMAAIDAKLAELDAKLSELLAAVSQRPKK
jgi:hypothetical protein